MARIMVVDDDPVCGNFLAKFLAHDGHEVKSIQRGHEAIEVSRDFMPDLLVTDWLLKDTSDGIDVARALLQIRPDIGIVFMTGLPAEQLDSQIGDIPVLKILEKPLRVDELFQEIRRLLAISSANAGR